MTIERRTLLKAAALAAASAAGAAGAGCDDAHRDAAPATTELTGTPAPSAVGSSPTGSSPSTTVPSTTVPSSASSSGAASPATSTPSTPTGGPAVEIAHGPTTATGVALTFHGAGDPTLANELLVKVEAVNGKVTVLAVGTWLEAQPQMAKRILGGGHDLGNHTYRHLTMTSLSPTVDDSEITKCADVLRRLTGTQGRWFRPSGTVHATPAILAAAGRAGYATSLSYDVDPADYTDPGAALVTSRVLDAVRPGSIVSLHLGHAGTVQAMPAILAGLQKRGLAAVTMSTLIDGASR
ncbi:MAG: polysaccharide deacetylase family protein [Acidothermaceae bacterium]